MKGHYSDVWQAIARAFPDRAAVIARERTMTYSELAHEAGALAAHFSDKGLRSGDAVAILSYNRPEYVVALFACFATGMAPVPINYRYRAAEVEELLRDSEARVLISPASLCDVAMAAAAALDVPPELIVLDEYDGADLGQSLKYSRLVRCDRSLPQTPPPPLPPTPPLPPPLPPTLPQTPPPGGELRLYTGGTTGRPKAVVWDAEDILEVQLYAIYGAVGLPLPETMDDVVRIAADPETPQLVTLPLAPFMHGTALFNSMNTLVLGGTIVVHSSPRLDADEAVQLIVDQGVTRLIVAGDAVAVPIVEAAERAGIRRLGVVNSIISSGMRFSEQVKRRLHGLGNITIIDMLASTEGGPFALNTTTSVDDLPGRLRLLPGAVILDDSMREVQDQPGARGMLAFRGALPQGYWHDEAKTEAAFPFVGGIRHVVPGDLAASLGDGYIELLGRGSAVVNTGGEKVYPPEVEEALLEHPAIRDAIVFGTPDDRFGQVVTAVIVPADDVVLDLADVRAHLDQQLAGYKKPRHILVRDSLDRSPHGKVDLVRWTREVADALSRDSTRSD